MSAILDRILTKLDSSALNLRLTIFASRFRLVLLFNLFFFLVFAVSAPHSANAQNYTEDQIKSAFIYNFLRFVEFPPLDHDSDKPEISVCVYSSRSFFRTISTLEGKAIQESIISVRNINAASRIINCSVVFVSSAHQLQVPRILERVRDKAILTIGEGTEFCSQGGMIELFRLGGRFRFTVNLPAAQAQSIIVSSKLLRLAHTVITDDRNNE